MVNLKHLVPRFVSDYLRAQARLFLGFKELIAFYVALLASLWILEWLARGQLPALGFYLSALLLLFLFCVALAPFYVGRRGDDHLFEIRIF